MKEIPKKPAIKVDRVELQLFTTLQCNLNCTYCSESQGGFRNSQHEVNYTLDQLTAFIEKHIGDREVFVTFYGGEPLLNIEFIEQVMRRFPLFRYQLQTNGTLLGKLPPEIIARLSNVLVSLDGGEAVTDSFRGKGCYQRVMKQLDHLRRHLQGTATARVTWASSATGFEDIDGLANLFDYVYFQFVHLPGVYDQATVEHHKGVLGRLVERFCESGQVYPLIPLMGCARNLLFPNRARELYNGLTQCRVSSHLLNVLPDGSIYACPDMIHIEQMKHGDIKQNWLEPNPLQPVAQMPCSDCEAYSYCRGNCMKGLHLSYVMGDDDYREGIFEPICGLIKFIGHSLQEKDLSGWYARLPVGQQHLLKNCEVYEYVEIMP